MLVITVAEGLEAREGVMMEESPEAREGVMEENPEVVEQGDPELKVTMVEGDLEAIEGVKEHKITCKRNNKS